MALWISNGVAQVIFIIVLFSESTYQIMYFIASTSILVPYLLSALFQFKLVITNELKDAKVKNGSLALIASLLLYMAYLCSWFEEFIARFNRIRNWDHCLCVRKKRKRKSLFYSYREICNVGNCRSSCYISLYVIDWKYKNVKVLFI